MSDNSKLEYASFWLRAAAMLIDSFILGTILMFVSLSIHGQASLAYGGYAAGPLDILIYFVLTPVAIILCWNYWQATPGKMVIEARIVDARTGKAPSTGQYVGRYFSYIPSALVFGLGFVWVAFDKKGQGWHDKLAGTVVVREEREERFFLDEPFTMEEATSSAVAKDKLEYTGFWRRILAYLIDASILSIGVSLIVGNVGGMNSFNPDDAMSWDSSLGPVDFLLRMVIPPVAVILCWIYWQATPGKMIISAKIVDARSGANPTPWQCVRRCLAYIPSAVFALGFLWIAFDERKQGWHDKLAGTVVVRKKNPDLSFADAQAPTREEAEPPPSGGAEQDATSEENAPEKDPR